MPGLRQVFSPPPGSLLGVDEEFYGRLANETDSRKQVDGFIIPVRSGRAWPMRAGQLCRIVVVEGPQVADLNVWNLHNPREHFYGARTRQFHRSHLTTYDRMWSSMPYLRPMLTITNDTIQYGFDEDGAGCHDLLGTRCGPYVRKMMIGDDYDFCCQSNLTRAIAPYRLVESDVHDPLNVFQVTGLTKDGRYSHKPSVAKRGDFFEFFAEIDLLCAISTCPWGDLSVSMWSGASNEELLANCRPLGIEVSDPDPALLEGWKSPSPPDYKGMHGMRLP